MDIQTLEDFEKLIKSCQKMGIKSIQMGPSGFSAELDTQGLFPESTYKKNKKEKEIAALKEPVGDPVAEAEKALFWSSGMEFEGAAQ